MNLREWLDHGEAILSDSPHPDRARRDAETLLLHHIGKNKAWLIAHGNEEFAGCSAIGYAALLDRRRKGEPIQYITGECEFYGLPFRVTSDVLIPRPETEHLVETVISKTKQLGAPDLDSETWEAPNDSQPANSGAPSIRRRLPDGWETTKPAVAPSVSNIRNLPLDADGTKMPGAPSIRRRLPDGWETTMIGRPLRILDVGTGSGAIAIALATQLPSATLTAMDISAPALYIARENAKRNGVAIRFLQGDLLSPVAGEHFEIIVSNPPYVPNTDRALIAVEVREHEPHVALFGGHDGLEIYRRLIPAAHAALVPGGYLAFEFGFSQQPDIESLLKHSGFENIEFIHDLQGIPRVASAQRL